MAMSSSTKYVLGAILLVILTTSAYVIFQDKVKIKVNPTNTEFFVWEGKWVSGGTEYIYLYNGSRKVNAINRSVLANYESNLTNITRTVNFPCGKIVDTYEFDGNTNDVERVPVNHLIERTGCKGLIVQFEYKGLSYDGISRNAVSPERFGHNISIEWGEGAYFAKVYQQLIDKLVIKYRANSDYEVYNVRMYDPVPSDFLELVENTDHCSDNCYTIYKVKNPTNFDYTIDSGTKKFLIQFIKNKATNRNIQISATNLSHYVEKTCNNFTSNTYIVLNGSIVYNNSNNPYNCSGNESYYNWNDFSPMGKTFQAHTEKYIKISGTLAANGFTGETEDNVLYFNGHNYTEYSTWDSGLNQNLLSYWKMDELTGNALDSVGGKTYTQIGTVASGGGIIGTARGKGTFGASNYFNMSPGRMHVLNSSQNWTVSFWVNSSKTIVTNEVPFAMGGATKFWTYVVFEGSGKVYLTIQDRPAGKIAQFFIPSRLQNGSYIHVVAIYNATAPSGTLYLNATDSATGFFDGAFTNILSQNESSLGMGFLSTEYGTDLTIDEVAIWNRTLSQAEITQLYNAGAGITYPVNVWSVNNMYPTNLSINDGTQLQTNFTGDELHLNCTGYLNGTIIGYNSTVRNNTPFNLTFSSLAQNGNRYAWNVSCNGTFGGTSYFNVSNITVIPIRNITLNYPLNNSIFLNSSFTFNVTGNYPAYNCSAGFNGNYSFYMNGTVINNTYTNFTIPLQSERGKSFSWTIRCNGTNSNFTRYFKIEDYNITITISAGTNLTVRPNASVGVFQPSGQNSTLGVFNISIFQPDLNFTFNITAWILDRGIFSGFDIYMAPNSTLATAMKLTNFISPKWYNQTSTNASEKFGNVNWSNSYQANYTKYIYIQIPKNDTKTNVVNNLSNISFIIQGVALYGG